MKRALLIACAFGLGAANMAQPANAANAATEGTVEGFGKDVPLSGVVRQIVPPGYAVTYGGGIDPNARVSWQGGSDWQGVLRSITARGKHLGVAVSGSGVAITDADAAYSGPMPTASAPVTATTASVTSPVRSAPLAEPSRVAYQQQATRGLIIIPYHREQPIQAVPVAPVVPVAVQEVSAPAAPMATVAAPPVVPVPVSVVHPVDIARPAVAPVVPTTRMAPKAQIAPVATPDAAPVAAPQSEAVDVPSAPVSARQRRLAAREARMAALHENPAPSSLPVRVLQSAVSDGEQTWHAKQNHTLDEVLGDWADKAGWTLVFSSRMIYQLQASADFDGNFIQAASSLVRSVRASPQPIVTFHQGNKTLVVSNSADQTN